MCEVCFHSPNSFTVETRMFICSFVFHHVHSLVCVPMFVFVRWFMFVWLFVFLCLYLLVHKLVCLHLFFQLFHYFVPSLIGWLGFTD